MKMKVRNEGYFIEHIFGKGRHHNRNRCSIKSNNTIKVFKQTFKKKQSRNLLCIKHDFSFFKN